MAKVLVSGGTGLIGSHLVNLLRKRGDEVWILSRSCKEEHCIQWDVKNKQLQLGDHQFDYVVHLAGAGIADKRWDELRKKEIIDSRVDSTVLLKQTFEDMPEKERPKAIVAASAIGIYGTETTDKIYTEDDGPEKGFLAHVVDLWELATNRFRKLNIPTTQLRIGVVLAKEGGALKEMTGPPVLAALGHGKQNIPWIHIEDLCRMIMWSLDHQKDTVYNAVGPEYVNNKAFMKIISKYSPKPLMPINAPAFVIKLMLGEMASLVLEGSKISSEKIREEGFEFGFKTADAALKDCLS